MEPFNLTDTYNICTYIQRRFQRTISPFKFIADDNGTCSAALLEYFQSRFNLFLEVKPQDAVMNANSFREDAIPCCKRRRFNTISLCTIKHVQLPKPPTIHQTVVDKFMQIHMLDKGLIVGACVECRRTLLENGNCMFDGVRRICFERCTSVEIRLYGSVDVISNRILKYNRLLFFLNKQMEEKKPKKRKSC